MRDSEEIFRHSYYLARGTKVHGVAFPDALFDNLLRSSPEVAQKVLRGGLETFRSTLLLSIDALASVYLKGNPSTILQGVAHRQGRNQRNIEPHLYEFFLKALLQTVEQYDPEYNDGVGKAWEDVLRPGIEYMKRMY